MPPEREDHSKRDSFDDCLAVDMMEQVPGKQAASSAEDLRIRHAQIKVDHTEEGTQQEEPHALQ